MKKLIGIGLLVVLVGATVALSAANKNAFDHSQEITVISREAGSGTRGAFTELFGVEQKDQTGNKVDYTTVEAIITNSTSVALMTVAGNRYAIGYVSLGSLNDSVKTAKIDGAEATTANIKNGQCDDSPD